MAIQRKMSFREFADDPKAALESLDRGDEDEVLIEMAGRQYRVEAVTPRDAIWTNYDAERAWAAMRASQGALEGVDTAQLKRDIKAARGQESKGRPGD